MFLMPLREIEKRFTKSEIVITAWRSQEVSYQMRKNFKSPSVDLSEETSTEETELDLSKMTSAQAFNYFSSIGLNFPVVGK